MNPQTWYKYNTRVFPRIQDVFGVSSGNRCYQKSMEVACTEGRVVQVRGLFDVGLPPIGVRAHDNDVCSGYLVRGTQGV